jgi:hypothetical protein
MVRGSLLERYGCVGSGVLLFGDSSALWRPSRAQVQWVTPLRLRSRSFAGLGFTAAGTDSLALEDVRGLKAVTGARAHTIRLLHARAHEDQAAQDGRTIRPEVGMGVVVDLSEVLVQVGLARY